MSDNGEVEVASYSVLPKDVPQDGVKLFGKWSYDEQVLPTPAFWT